VQIDEMGGICLNLLAGDFADDLMGVFLAVGLLPLAGLLAGAGLLERARALGVDLGAAMLGLAGWRAEGDVVLLSWRGGQSRRHLPAWRGSSSAHPFRSKSGIRVRECMDMDKM
jgi:hypothetical protein